MSQRITLDGLKSFVTSYVAEAKQAGAWTSNKDSITGLVEKCAKTFTLDDGGFVDLLPELDGQLKQGFIEEYFAGLVPATGRKNDGSDELAPARPEFDEPFYSYPLLDTTTGLPGIRFKTTVDDEWFERYLQSGDDGMIVNYIIKKLYDSYFTFKYDAKRQLIGNMINKAVDAQAGETYTTNSTIIKCGHIYVQSAKFYIAKENRSAAINKTLAQLAVDNWDGSGAKAVVVEIVPDLVKKIAKPVDDTTGEAFIKQIKDDVEKLTIGPSEGTSIAGSTIGAPNSELMLYIKPGIKGSLDVDTLAGAFNVSKLAIPAMIKVLPDFGTIDDTGVYAVLVDRRGMKLNENYTKANATPVNGSLYTNYFLHYGATAFISKHCAVKVYTVTGL